MIAAAMSIPTMMYPPPPNAWDPEDPPPLPYPNTVPMSADALAYGATMAPVDLMPYQQQLLPPAGSSPRMRGAPLSIKTGKIKRSMSTPNVRGQATIDAAATALDKRRNKLGYHRTSIACGHCRKRKIRCIRSHNEQESRCVNCVRLKRECQFFPVEQDPSQQDSSQNDSRAQSSENASNLPSPTTPSSQLHDVQAPVIFPQMGMPTLQEIHEPQVKQEGVEGLSPTSTGLPPQQAVYESYPHNNWMASKFSPMSAAPGDLPEYLGFAQESPITPGFSPFTPTMPQHSMTWSAHPEHAPKDIPWHTPQRSISYSNLEGLHHHNVYAYPPATRAGEPANPRSRLSHGNVFDSSTAGASHLTPTSQTTAMPVSAAQSSTALSGSISSASSYGSWQPQYGYSKSPHSSIDVYAPWNPMHQVQAETPESAGASGDYTLEPVNEYYATPGTPIQR